MGAYRVRWGVLESSASPLLDHPGIDDLLATVLTSDVRAHLERCVPCRIERDRLREALAAEIDVEEQDLIGARVRVHSALARQTRTAGATIEVLFDGEPALHLVIQEDERELVADLPAAYAATIRARFEAARAVQHRALLAWQSLEAVEDGIRARCAVPRCERLHGVHLVGPAEVARLVGQAAAALVALHTAGLSHGGVERMVVGITDSRRLVLAPPDLCVQVHAAEDRRALGALLESWLDRQDLRAPRLVQLAADLQAGAVASPVALLDAVLEVWDGIRGGASRYVLDRQLGEGGMGVVFRATDLTMRRDVALKVQKPQRQDDRRFLREARITASLQHPGVVPVHDLGELNDGRVYYTMEEIDGPDLGAAIRALHRASTGCAWGTADGWTLRRLVDVLARIADALGFAHARGLVHCDIKPDNIKLGAHGAVRLMDWGMATPVGGLRRGGTLGYMLPEQGAGRAVDVASDVYAMGRVLLDLLLGVGRTEAREHGPPPPAGLVALARRCMSVHDPERPAEGGALARALRDWLDGVQRRERAERTLQAVVRFQRQAEELRAQAAELRRRAEEVLAEAKPWEPAEAKVHGWRDESEAEVLRGEAAVLEARYEQGLRAALRLDPSHPSARERLIALYKESVLRAEAQRDVATATRFSTLLQHEDDGRNLAWIRGDGALTLITEPRGAMVEVQRYEEEDRRLVARTVETMGPTPILAHTLPRGSYLLRIRHPRCEEVRYPVLIDRGAHWDGVPPGGSEAEVVRLPAKGSLGSNDVFVPQGWFVAGGDAEAADPLARRRLWCDALVVRRFPVTHAGWRHWLDGLVRAGELDRAMRLVPSRAGTAQVPQSPLYTLVQGRFRPAPELPEGVPAPLGDRPVNGVDWHAARAFAAWEAQRTGEPWRLPHDCEWAKAARGVDGRAFPWGNGFDGSFACGGASFESMPTLPSIHTFAVDESPYGARLMAGHVREWCLNGYERTGPEADRIAVKDDADAEPWRMVRGGGYFVGPVAMRAASRAVCRPDQRLLLMGVRLVRPA